MKTTDQVLLKHKTSGKESYFDKKDWEAQLKKDPAWCEKFILVDFVKASTSAEKKSPQKENAAANKEVAASSPANIQEAQQPKPKGKRGNPDFAKKEPQQSDDSTHQGISESNESQN